MNKKDMPSSRRDFVVRASLLATVPFLKPLMAFGDDLQATSGTLIDGDLSYQLFFDHLQLESIRTRFNTADAFADLRAEFESFDRVAERAFVKDQVVYNDHLIDLGRLGRSAPIMAFQFLMTGDRDAAQLAADLIEEILKFPTWDYFLEDGHQVLGIQRASSSVVAITLAADWLGDFIDAETRSRWIKMMGEKGCEACFLSIYGMRYPDRVKGWTMDRTSGYFVHRPYENVDLANWPYILNGTNLKAVPASALAISAAAFESEFGRSEDTDRWLEQAAYSIKSFGDIYADDGSYNENLSYGNYTSEHLAQGMEILQRLRGIDLKDEINWPGYVDFMYGMSMPNDDEPAGIANFGDAGNGMMSSVPYWIANNFKDPRATWFANNLSRGHNMWSAIWYNDGASVAPENKPSMYRSQLDWISARAGYGTKDLVVAMRSGSPSNHEHADRNSIIVKCHGEILVADPYRPPYANTDPSWRMRLTEGHSGLLIDGKGHQYHDGMEGTNPSDAVAKIVRTMEYGNTMSWSSDATSAYQLVDPDVGSVMRSVFIALSSNTIIVVDKVTKVSVPSRITARFFAKNVDSKGSMVMNNNHFTSSRPAASLDGYGYAIGGATIESKLMDIAADRASQHPFADVSTNGSNLKQTLITVLQPRKATQSSIPVHFMQTDNVTSIVAGELRIDVTDAGSIPEFQIV